MEKSLHLQRRRGKERPTRRRSGVIHVSLTSLPFADTGIPLVIADPTCGCLIFEQALRTSTSPRAFLLSLTSVAPPHMLLVAHWGTEGAVVLSLPTREYFQSSGWVEERRRPDPTPKSARGNGSQRGRGGGDESRYVRSVRSGSDFWASHRSRTPSSSAYTAGGSSGGTGMSSFSHSHSHSFMF
jgi:hypothetical protein